MRTITVTGGFSGTATVDLVDSLQQLATATFKMALAPAGQDDPPIAADAAWKNAVVTNQTAGAATVSLAVDDTQPVGSYHVAVDVILDGRHEAIWATDRRSRARSLVVVT